MEITEQELSIINRVAKSLSPIFAFGYYDREDIEQEIRLICLQIMDKYDEEKSNLYNFLFVHSRNMLIDLRRLKLGRTISPCKDCANFNEGICGEFENIADCKKYRIRLDNNAKKKALINAHLLDENQLWVFTDYGEKMDNDYICGEIDREIPAWLRRDYLRFLDGVSLPHYNRKMVVDKIREIAITKGFIWEEEE